MPFNYSQVYDEVGCDPASVLSLPVPDISSRISMIQVESLDWAALYKKINGKEVTPNLNTIARRALVLKLDGMKHFVSANSEYEMLNSKIARAFFLYFEYLNKYNNSIILPFKYAGYETSLIHGVTSSYMNRRYAYPKMGFDSNFFFEQIQDRGYQVTPGLFEYNIADYDLMKFAADYAKDKDYYLHFIITVTMHASVEAKTPAYEKWDGYWRSVNYFDEGLGLYLKSLPEGSTVILYGDHQSYHGPEKNDLVPFLIYIKGRNLSKLKTPPGMVYTRCELSHYLRRIFIGHLDKTSGMTGLTQPTE
jgi:phosphoglycerol transferase MdoB-like AlkP superfamily enzyme